MKAWKHDSKSGAVGNWAAMVMVRVFMLGILFISNHLNCSGKELFRRLLSIPSEVLLIADQSRKFVLHRLVLITDHTSRTHPHLPDTALASLESSVRYEHKLRFSG